MNDYLDVATQLAQEAGKIMRANFAIGMKKEWKEDFTPLTISDTTINSLVIKTLSEKYPSMGIIGEEESYKKESEYQWICDPIDGTFAFSHGFPTFAFSLALTKNGESVLGVIYDPIMDRMLTAVKGEGAFLNGQAVHVGSESKLNSTSFVSVDGHKRLTGIKDYLVKQYDCSVPVLCSTVYCGMLVALGEFTGSIYEYTKPWDAAALKVIVEEAGGKVTDLNGLDQRYDGTINGFITSNGLVHDRLVDACKKFLSK